MQRQTSNLPGLFFIGFGVIFLIDSFGLRMGTLSRMGAGYFPALVAGLLILFGLLQIDWRVRQWPEGVRTLAGGLRNASELRPLVLMFLAALVFFFGIERVGLFPTVFASALTATFCFRRPTLLLRLFTAAGIALFTSAVFVGLLGVRIEVVAWSI